jgi:phasin family protein
MIDLDQHKSGGKSARNKKKRNRKAGPQQSREHAQAVSEAVDAAMAEPVAADASLEETAPAEPMEAAASVPPVARADTAQAAPETRVASFRERLASIVPPADIAPGKPVAAPADVAKTAPSPATAPAAGIQAIANAYRDYTRKSLEDAQSFAEKLTAARSLDKAMEAQSEFARKACETFAADSRKIRELHRELFWQTFRLPNWPLGRSRQS